MPELPEVEVIKQSVERALMHQKIIKVAVRTPKMRYPMPANIKSCLAESRFTAFERRAKYLLLTLTKQTSKQISKQTTKQTQSHRLVFHMGMSGRLRIDEPHKPHLKHDHLVLFTASHKLAFYDPRRFGFVRWKSQLEPTLQALGVEATAITPAQLEAITKPRPTAIKQVLLNQKLIAGLGNIYVLEALFLASINPHTSAASLTKPAIKRLSDALRKTLARAIADGGSTIKDHFQPMGEAGYFQTRFRVYGRKNMPCFRCKSFIIRVVQNQRATFYCDKCQK